MEKHFEPKHFPKVTPPVSKGHSSERSPLWCSFKGSIMRFIWREHPVSYSSHSTPLEKEPGMPGEEDGSGKLELWCLCTWMRSQGKAQQWKGKLQAHRGHVVKAAAEETSAATINTENWACVAINSAHVVVKQRCFGIEDKEQDSLVCRVQTSQAGDQEHVSNIGWCWWAQRGAQKHSPSGYLKCGTWEHSASVAEGRGWRATAGLGHARVLKAGLQHN